MTTPENPIRIGENDFKFEELTPEAQTLVQHMISIDGKLTHFKFEMDQLQIGRQAVYTQLFKATHGEDDMPHKKGQTLPDGAGGFKKGKSNNPGKHGGGY